MHKQEEFFSRYLPANDKAKNWQLWCTTVGRASVQPGGAYPPRRGGHPPQYAKTLRAGRVLDEYQMVYIIRGKGLLRDAKDQTHREI